jgi:hypothetical protein
VAFDVAPYVSFGPKAASVKPGAVRCAQGHNHIYFPRDFGFFSFAVAISDDVMRENREVYRSINSVGPRPLHDSAPKAVEPPAKPVSDVPEIGKGKGNAQLASLGPDPRRESAQAAAKERWANWAGQKVL